MKQRAWPIALLLLMLLVLPRSAHASPGFTEQCEAALLVDQVDELVAAMRAVEGRCQLQRVDTTTFRTVIEWIADGRSLVVLLGPRDCVREPTQVGTALAFHAPDALGQACPEVLAAVQEFVGEPHDVAQVSSTHALLWSSEPQRRTFADPRIASSVAWLGVLLLVVICGRQRGRALVHEDRRWTLLAAGGFAMGLLARCMVEPSLGNWYGAFLPSEGWGELRFGSSAAILQAGVRSLAPWTVDVAYGLARVVGVLAVPLGIVLVRRLGGSLSAAALAGIVLALEPIPVRISASSSEHALAATLALAAWATWMRTAVDASAVPRVLAMLLVWLAVMARVDCLPQLALIPLWTTLCSREGWRPLAERLADAAWFAVCLAAILVHGWFTIVVPSNHPGPELEAITRTITLLLEQFWVVMIQPPHWLTPTCLLAVTLGLLAAIVQRRWGLLAAALLSVVLIFVPLGRNLTHDGLTGARYFVLLMPLLAVIASVLVERARGRIAVLGLACFAALELGAAQPGWRHEYTFQAEYRFLAQALREHADQLDGCTLWYVRPRQGQGEADLDCCLWPSNSPLTLLAPELRFRALPAEREPDDAQGCHLYYQGSVCELDPAKVELSPLSVERILAQCERLRQHAGERELASEHVTDVTLSPRFHARPFVWLRARGLDEQ